MINHHGWMPPWILGDHMSPYTAISTIMMLSLLFYILVTIDTARQAYSRNGNPFIKRFRSPLIWAEWAICFMFSGNLLFSLYRVWIRMIEHGGSSDPRLFYSDAYRMLGVAAVYFTTQYARRWLIDVLPEEGEEDVES